MSYCRWIESKWYVYPSTDGPIVIWRAGESPVYWRDGSLDEILAKVGAAVEHDGEFDSDMEDLREILQENMEDIQKYLKKCRETKENSK